MLTCLPSLPAQCLLPICLLILQLLTDLLSAHRTCCLPLLCTSQITCLNHADWPTDRSYLVYITNYTDYLSWGQAESTTAFTLSRFTLPHDTYSHQSNHNWLLYHYHESPGTPHNLQDPTLVNNIQQYLYNRYSTDWLTDLLLSTLYHMYKYPPASPCILYNMYMYIS